MHLTRDNVLRINVVVTPSINAHTHAPEKIPDTYSTPSIGLDWYYELDAGCCVKSPATLSERRFGSQRAGAMFLASANAASVASSSSAQ